MERTAINRIEDKRPGQPSTTPKYRVCGLKVLTIKGGGWKALLLEASRRRTSSPFTCSEQQLLPLIKVPLGNDHQLLLLLLLYRPEFVIYYLVAIDLIDTLEEQYFLCSRLTPLPSHFRPVEATKKQFLKQKLLGSWKSSLNNNQLSYKLHYNLTLSLCFIVCSLVMTINLILILIFHLLLLHSCLLNSDGVGGADDSVYISLYSSGTSS